MRRLFASDRDLRLTPHILFEVYRGILRAGRRPEEEGLDRLRETFGTLPYERHAAREVARIAEVLRRDGNEIPLGDLCIAASTIVWGDGEIVT
jgi:predicted nucleic acid-binding protein